MDIMMDVIVDRILNDEKKMERIANTATRHDKLGQAGKYICALSREYRVKFTNDQTESMAWKILEEVLYGGKA